MELSRAEENLACVCVFVYDVVNSGALRVPGKHPTLLTLRLLFFPVKLDHPGSWQDLKWTGRRTGWCSIRLGTVPNDNSWEVPKARACA